jgi:hypothetical protein
LAPPPTSGRIETYDSELRKGNSKVIAEAAINAAQGIKRE